MRAWQRFRRISPAPADDTYAATGSGALYQASCGAVDSISRETRLNCARCSGATMVVASAPLIA